MIYECGAQGVGVNNAGRKFSARCALFLAGLMCRRECICVVLWVTAVA